MRGKHCEISTPGPEESCCGLGACVTRTAEGHRGPCAPSPSYLSLLLAPPSWSTWEGKTAVHEMPQNRPLWALLSVLFPHFAAKPSRGPLNGEQVDTHRGHSPDAAAPGKLPRWALVLPGEWRAWHRVLAGRGLALQEVRAASRSTCRPRHALWPRGTWADAPLWEQTHLRFKKE